MGSTSAPTTQRRDFDCDMVIENIRLILITKNILIFWRLHALTYVPSQKDSKTVKDTVEKRIIRWQNI